MSEGSRSGVHCTRLNVPPMERAMARPSIVFPTPGTSVRSRCPEAASTAADNSMTERLPTMTRSRLASSDSRTARPRSMVATVSEGTLADDHAGQGAGDAGCLLDLVRDEFAELRHVGSFNQRDDVVGTRHRGGDLHLRDPPHCLQRFHGSSGHSVHEDIRMNRHVRATPECFSPTSMICPWPRKK